MNVHREATLPSSFPPLSSPLFSQILSRLLSVSSSNVICLLHRKIKKRRGVVSLKSIVKGLSLAQLESGEAWYFQGKKIVLASRKTVSWCRNNSVDRERQPGGKCGGIKVHGHAPTNTRPFWTCCVHRPISNLIRCSCSSWSAFSTLSRFDTDVLTCEEKLSYASTPAKGSILMR